MATLHKEFIKYNKSITLDDNKKDNLKKSRNGLRKKIQKWFSENKSDELQPKFSGQGSFEMNTTVNPIPVKDPDENTLLKYDLDYGIYFIDSDSKESNRRNISTLHDWVYKAVDSHTNQPTISKNTCIRVVYTDGHHIDLPIYYKNGETIELAHKGKGYLISDPKAFFDWFNTKKNMQLERMVRYLKAWKNYREVNNTNLKLPSGFELTILATNNYQENDNDDIALKETVKAIHKELSKPKGFKCIRPTVPEGEDVFSDYSETRKSNFLSTLESLVKDLEQAEQESNFKKASEILIDNQFGDRFPVGEDVNENDRSNSLSKAISSSIITPKPYGY